MSAMGDHGKPDWEGRLRSHGAAREHMLADPPEALLAAVECGRRRAVGAMDAAWLVEGAPLKLVTACLAAGLLAIASVPSPVDRVLSPAFVAGLGECVERWSGLNVEDPDSRGHGDPRGSRKEDQR